MELRSCAVEDHLPTGPIVQVEAVRIMCGLCDNRRPIEDALAARVAELEQELEAYRTLTYCAYCGQSYPLDNQAAEMVTQHIQSCSRHPMREVKAERDRLRKALEKIRGIDYRGNPCQCSSIAYAALTPPVNGGMSGQEP